MSNAKTLQLQFADGEIEVGTLIDALYEQERTIAILRQHKNDYMEAAEGTRKALKAENARLSKFADEANAQMLEAFEERDAALAQLAAIQQAKGEEVEVVGSAAFNAAGNMVDFSAVPQLEAHPEGHRVEQLMTVAQHQRVTAAMAAEVERWKSAAQTNWNEFVESVDETAALRAELAAVKGQEAVAVKTHGAWDGLDLLESMPDGTKLYALPPASPDVEGLVKALELWLADYDEVAANPDFEPHPHVAERVTKSRAALSTWRQLKE